MLPVNGDIIQISPTRRTGVDPPVSTDFVPAQDMIQVKVWKSDIEESESEDEEETKNQAEIKDSEEEEEQEKGKQDKEEEVPRLDGIETRI